MANKYLLKVENRNYPSALYNLAINYYYGRGLEKDIVKAKNLFHRVHRLNKSSESALMLGKIALKEKQYEIAINFFLESLNNGNPKGAYELGKYYVENAQIRGNLEKSIRFYNIAIDEGVLPAYYHLAKLKIIQYNVFENEQSKIEAYELADKVSRLDLRIGNETLKMVKDLDKDIIKLKDSGN